MNIMKTAHNPVMEALAHGAGRSPVLASTEPMVASYLTHELRAPLTSIRMALTLLQENLTKKLKPDQNELLALAIKNSERLSFLISDILDYHKIQSGKMHLERKPARPQPMIQEATDSMNAWAISKRIKLLRVFDGEPLPRVWADPQRVIQVLINLVSNAIKYTPSGGRIEVSAVVGKNEHAGTVLFSVKDTGCGISKADLKRVFHCFEQSSGGVKAGEGTGLGLTLAEAMVKLHGGRIWAESWQGLGSVFWFTLPIAPEDMPRPVDIYSKPVWHFALLSGALRRFNTLFATLI